MNKRIAAILAFACLTMTACGHMPEATNAQPTTEQTEMTTTTDAETTAETTETETQKETRKSESKKNTSTTAQMTQSTGTSTVSTKTTGGTTVPGATAASPSGGNTVKSGGNSGGSSGKSSSGSSNKSSSGSSNKSSSSGGSASKSTTAKNTTTAKTTTKATTVTTKAATAEAVTDAPTTEAPVTEAPAPQDGVTKIVNGVMVVHSGTDHPRALELYSGNLNNGTRYAQTLNSYKAALGDGVNVYCMVVPTSQAFYTPAEEAPKYGNQLDMYNTVTANFDGVVGVPVYEALDAHKDEQTYSRTDYHWQPLGAYYAAEQFAAYAGVPFAGLETYEAVVREGYVGAFYRVNGVSELGSHPEQFTYFKPSNLDACTFTYYNTAFGGAHQGSLFFENNSINASYTVFVGSDECILEADTNAENDRVLVIFKDSYGNALVPFLTQSFSKIYLCDFRYFDRNAISFLQEVGATDLLFAMSSVAVSTSSKVDMVARNLTK